MGGLLSPPLLVALAWVMAGAMHWHIRHGATIAPLLPWTMAAMALVAIAMALLLVTVPAPLAAQLVRTVLLVEGVAGFWLLARHAQDGSGDERR